MGVWMNSAQSAGAIVADLSGRALAVLGNVDAVLPVTFALLPESGRRLRGVFNFRGQAGFGQLVGNAQQSYAALGALGAGGDELLARKPGEAEISLGLKVDAKS